MAKDKTSKPPRTPKRASAEAAVPRRAARAKAGSGPGKAEARPVATWAVRVADPPPGGTASPAGAPSGIVAGPVAEQTIRRTQLAGLFATNAVTPASGSLGDLRVLPVRVSTPMDPRLQLAITNGRMGKRGLTTSSTTADEVAVVARVTDPEKWRELADVTPGTVMGQTQDKSWIVTGRVSLSRAEAVRNEACVLSLKASQAIRPSLGATVSAMMVAPGSLPKGTRPQGGRGVVVGIVDFGCDFAHDNFRNAAGKTRLEAIWHQAGVARPDSPFGYGRVYDRSDIDAALRAADPYKALGYGPDPDSPQEIGTHGTHVMDIAAGNGLGSGQVGVAPEVSLVFVEASISDIEWSGPTAVRQSLGDSVQLLEAVRYIFDTAGDRPCVVNLSLGTNGGPHDGSSLVEQGLDALLAEKPGRAIVIAASNSQQDNIHASGTVAPASDHDIMWSVRDEGGGEFELWYPGDRSLELTLIAPDGTSFGPLAPDANLPIGTGSNVSIFMSSRRNDPNNHDNVLGIWIASGLSTSDWTIRLRSLDGKPVDYHGWIERLDGAQSSFAKAVPTHTLGSISTGRSTIVVGSYDAHKQSRPISSFSSSGPTRDGRQKPEVSAPGHSVMAARSRTRTGVVRKSGTSMASPAITGLVALVLAEAARKRKSLTIDEIRKRLIDGSLDNPPLRGATGWDARYGVGRASGTSIVV